MRDVGYECKVHPALNVPNFITLLNSQSSPSTDAIRIHRELSHPPWMKELFPMLSSYLHPTSLYPNICNSLGHREDVPYKSEGLPLLKEDLSAFRNAFQETVWLSLSLECDTFTEGIELICSFPLLETVELHGDWFHEHKVLIPCHTLCLPSKVLAFREVHLSFSGSFTNRTLCLFQAFLSKLLMSQRR